MLRTLPIPRKALGSKKLYDRMDLDAFADQLEYDGHAGDHSVQDALDNIKW